MQVFNRGAELSAALGNEKVLTGFVPTMGALHEGHVSLVERCRRECRRVVVSVFVNPTQFNDPADLRSYPRNLEADLKLLEAAGADFVYAPSVEDVYPEPDTRQFDLGQTDKVMEGAHRPGHFNGVAQVVSRLFAIVQPDKAYFGEKDFQQIAVIRAMVRQLQIPVQIVPCPIVRGADGLALSSRNALLTAEHRAAAPQIYAAAESGCRIFAYGDGGPDRAGSLPSGSTRSAAEDGISFGRPCRDDRGRSTVAATVPDALLHGRAGGRRPPDRQHRHRLALALRNAGPDESAVFEYSDIFI